MMTAEIRKKVTTMHKTSDITCRKVLSCTKRVEAQGAQTGMLRSIQGNKGFDIIKYTKPHHETLSNSQTKRGSQYFSMGHKARRCPGFEKRCTGCGKSNHFQNVWKNPTKKAPLQKPKHDQRVDGTCKDSNRETENLIQ